jgi:hypothetical protein
MGKIMGSFYSSCNVSHLQINDNDRIVALLLKKESDEYHSSASVSVGEYHKIASFALSGYYNDYGRIMLDDTIENRESFNLMIKVLKEHIKKEEFPTEFEKFEDLEDLIWHADKKSKFSNFAFTFFHEQLFHDLIKSDLRGHNQEIQSSWDNWENIVKQVWHHYDKTKNPNRFVRLLQKPYAFSRLEHDIEFSDEEKALLQLRTRDVEYFVDSCLGHHIEQDLSNFVMMDYMDLLEDKNTGDLHSLEGYTNYRNQAVKMHQFYEGLDYLNCVLLPQVTSGQEFHIAKENEWQMKVLSFTHDKILSMRENGYLEDYQLDNIKETQIAMLENQFLEQSVENQSSTKKGIKI